MQSGVPPPGTGGGTQCHGAVAVRGVGHRALPELLHILVALYGFCDTQGMNCKNLKLEVIISNTELKTYLNQYQPVLVFIFFGKTKINRLM